MKKKNKIKGGTNYNLHIVIFTLGIVIISQQVALIREWNRNSNEF